MERLPFLDPIDVALTGLPPALEGFRILHVSDLHVRGPRRRFEEVLAAVGGCEYELLAITGDSMVEPGDEPAAAEFLTRLARAARPRIATLGVWGNHDTPDLRARVIHLPIRWLVNTAWPVPGLPLTILGVDCARKEHHNPRGDLAAALYDAAATHSNSLSLAELTRGVTTSGAGMGSELHPPPLPKGEGGKMSCRVLLAHIPTWLPPAADVGIDLVLSGHTHAGQVRLPTGHILYNATPGWPCRYSSGLLQLNQTQCLISRGLGEVYIPGLRFFCKPQIPLITLRRGEGSAPSDRITHIRRW